MHKPHIYDCDVTLSATEMEISAISSVYVALEELIQCYTDVG